MYKIINTVYTSGFILLMLGFAIGVVAILTQ